MRKSLCIVIALLLGPSTLTADEPINTAEAFPKPRTTRSDEPMAEKFSLQRGAEYLDGAAMAWLRERKCASCHTSYPFVLARGMIGDTKAPALLVMRKFLDDRINGWDAGGKGVGLPAEEDEAVTEVVATATTLALFDRQTTGKLQPNTRRALDRMWTLQRSDGAWTWNQHQLPPQELDEYYGVVYAAIGVGHAPEGYAKGDSAKEGVAALRRHLAKNPPPNLHHKLLLAWASFQLDGLMTPAERTRTLRDVVALQREDGGWNLPSLGNWKRLDGQPNDPNAQSDGYATGLVLYLLKQSEQESNKSIERGLAWLKSNQRASGRWFTRSLNADRAHYTTNAGSAYALMAIKAWE